MAIFDPMRRAARHALLFFIPVLACCVSLQAAAQSFEDAFAEMQMGNFLAAADAGEQLATSQGYALAAESLGIHGYYRASDDDKQELFKRGWENAEKAIALDGNNANAHLQHAHTMGRYAQTIGVLEALNEGFATKIREALDSALALDPDLAGAHISLGAWHAEIVASAGFMAGILYGAGADDAIAHYQKALSLIPDAGVAHLEYAIGLITLDVDEYAAEACQSLARAIESPAPDAFAEIVREQAQERLAVLKNETGACN